MKLKDNVKFSFLKTFFFTVFSLIIIFFLFEFLIRFFLPQYNYNAIFYEKSETHKVFKGVDTFFFKHKSIENFLIRVKSNKDTFEFNKNKNKIVFIGDSISLGYGVEFEENYIEIIKSQLSNNIQVIGLSNLNRNYRDINDTITEDLINFLKEGDKVVYQFSYNDIMPINTNKNDIKRKETIFQKFQKIKFKYLNYSSFIKFLNYHASLINKKMDQDCLERKYYSLGQYTYAFYSKGFENESEKSWFNFKERIKKTKKILENRKIQFYILVSPMSLQLKNHEVVNKLKFSLNCSAKDGHKIINQIANEDSINLIDPLIEFKKSQSNGFQQLFHEFDTAHYNKLGYKLIANEVLKKIKNK